MQNQRPATKEDIKIVSNYIKQVKTDFRSLHRKFDTLNYRTGRHSGTINVHITLITKMAGGLFNSNKAICLINSQKSCPTLTNFNPFIILAKSHFKTMKKT